MISKTFLVSKLGILFLGPPAIPDGYQEPMVYVGEGGGERVPPEASPEDVGTLMGLGKEGPR